MAERSRASVSPLGLALTYAIFGVVYILFSDSLLTWATGDMAQYQMLQTAKGWVFILGTSVALWALTRKALARLTGIAQAAVTAEDRLRLALSAAEGLIWHLWRAGPDLAPLWQVSGGLARPLGLPEGKALAMDEIAALVHAADRKAFRLWGDAVVDGRPGQAAGLFRFRTAPGEARAYRWIKLVPDLASADGAPDGGGNGARIGVAFDLTEQQEAAQDFAEVIFGAELGTWRLDLSTGRNKINDRWAALIGYERAELEPMTDQRFYDLVHPDDLVTLLDRQADRWQRGTYLFSDEIRMRHKDGHWVWILTRSRAVDFSDSGEPVVLSGVHVDISVRKALEAALQQERDFLRGLTETSVSGILALDGAGVISFANREAGEILGLDEAGLTGQSLIGALREVHTLDGAPLAAAARPHVQVIRDRIILRDQRLAIGLKDGRQKAISVNAAPMRLSDGRVQAVASVTDITAQLATEAALRDAAAEAKTSALHDAMTGLPNRTLFEQDLTSALELAAQGGGGLLHVFLDIDNFKQVNDRFGHHVGDILIRAVAGRLEALRRPGQVLARVAGDEFSFLHPIPPRTGPRPTRSLRFSPRPLPRPSTWRGG